MDKLAVVCIGVCLLVSAIGEAPTPKMSCDEIRKWLVTANNELQPVYTDYLYAYWTYETNITNANTELQNNASLEKKKYDRSISNLAKQQKAKCDNDTNRQIRLLQLLDTSPHNDIQNKRLVKIKTKMATLFTKAKASRPGTNKKFSLVDLNAILANSNDNEDMKWAWEAWRDVSGRPLKKLYSEYIKLSNIGARDNGFADYGDVWRQINYMTPDIDKVAKNLYQQLQPMYQQLFRYIRRKLIKAYGAEKSGISNCGPIPAHLLGDMWAESWTNLITKGIALPYPNAPSIDIKNELIKKKYTVRRLVEMAEEFFKSIGLYPVMEDFWKNSIFVKPNDGREMSCHATAWGFHDQTRFRIQMCARVTHTWLVTIHHEMGHIQYLMAYKDKPLVYQDGANTAFHEAIGEAIALSVTNVHHLRNINLTTDTKLTTQQQKEQEINGLMQQALNDISALPFSYIVDKMRWGMFDGSINADNYNRKWWELRLEYQGVVPPVKRSQLDLDLASRFHIPNDYSYLRYFLSRVIQYQFYKALCNEAGHKGPLHDCDFYRSKAAGCKLKKMLKMGKSRPWPDAMKVMTGQCKICATAMIEYYKPLTDWLKIQNKDEKLDWYCGRSVESIINEYFG